MLQANFPSNAPNNFPNNFLGFNAYFSHYLKQEKDIVSKYLRQHFGYYLLLLGQTDLSLVSNSPVLIQIPVSLPQDFDQRSVLKKIELVADYSALPFFPESMDVIVLAHALGKLKNLEILEVLKESYKTLRHDGILIISEFNFFNFSARKFFYKNKIKYKFYPVWVIKKYLDQAGFDCLELKIISGGYVLLAKKKTMGLTPLSLKAMDQLAIKIREPLLISEREGI